jgi:hypothetical protein
MLVSLLTVGCAGVSPSPAQLGTLNVSASSFNFQTVVVGQTATQTLTLSNTGTVPVQISTLSVSNKEFAITGPSVPRVILPANSLSYTVTFAPTTAGNASASLSITSNASAPSESVALAGNGEKAFANLAVTPALINFGNQPLQSTSTQNVTLQNTGDINLALQGITVSGAGFGYSNLSPGFTLAPNQTVTFQVWFTPKVAGVAAATVSLLSPNISSPATLSLSGNGLAPSTPPPSTPPPTTAQHTVHLTWSASTSQVIGYRVYRSEASNGFYSALNGTAISALAYDDATVSNGTTYYYVVTAVDAAGDESVQSNQATAVIPAS